MLQLIVSMGLHLENVILLFDAEIALSCLAQSSEKRHNKTQTIHVRDFAS